MDNSKKNLHKENGKCQKSEVNSQLITLQHHSVQPKNHYEY